ncbi:Uncharacterised protein [Klebsiella pneumoniae]|nr:Uncharacterised protein [Klebsiella pneumoniae]
MAWGWAPVRFGALTLALSHREREKENVMAISYS